MDNSSSVIEFTGSNFVQRRILAIQEEYRSNARLLTYFAQTNPAELKEDNLALLETALLRRQQMLLDQIAGVRSGTLQDLRAKLEIWAQESTDEGDPCAQSRIVLSVMEDVRRLSA
jgi:hypothetical protein